MACQLMVFLRNAGKQEFKYQKVFEYDSFASLRRIFFARKKNLPGKPGIFFLPGKFWSQKTIKSGKSWWGSSQSWWVKPESWWGSRPINCIGNSARDSKEFREWRQKEIRTGGYSGPFFWGGGGLWRRGPNLPPFSINSTVLDHFILKLLNIDIILYYF